MVAYYHATILDQLRQWLNPRHSKHWFQTRPPHLLTVKAALMSWKLIVVQKALFPLRVFDMSLQILTQLILDLDLSNWGTQCIGKMSDIGSGAVTVRRGRSAVLQCGVDPGDTLLIVTWKIHLRHSSCIISYKTEENNTKTSHSSCTTRMRSDNLSLEISNTEISDEGNYNCEVVNDKNTFFRNTSLQVLAQPTTFLKLNSDGSPECGAIGGNPPAQISWIPHSDDINTTILEEPHQTWTVISTFSRKKINGNSVTCFVSHPTFANPWKDVITYSDMMIYYLVPGFVISFILICFIIWKLKYLRTCFKEMVNTDPQRTQNDCEENKQEFEPYATYTQNDNVIYCVASTFIGFNEAASSKS
ncbi:cell surface glycoprotein CD200 receptor 1-A-like [Rhinoderma darwinii]|uniref:cell surface glycoprotein CD200 receptor 1-A-like n=1 Tax=Rhinoderma darwinii TaxID=43563 RepID=UPI003F664341